MKTALRLGLAAAVLSALPLMAYPVAFSGSGASGVDPFGHSWSTDVSGWGCRDIVNGTLTFHGTVLRHRLPYRVLWMGLTIDYDACGRAGVLYASTRFSATSDGLLWTRVPESLSAVSFYAPAGTSSCAGRVVLCERHFYRRLRSG